jgi:hypothetical protein
MRSPKWARMSKTAKAQTQAQIQPQIRNYQEHEYLRQIEIFAREVIHAWHYGNQGDVDNAMALLEIALKSFTDA